MFHSMQSPLKILTMRQYLEDQAENLLEQLSSLDIKRGKNQLWPVTQR